jgi:hypothetical protein
LSCPSTPVYSGPTDQKRSSTSLDSLILRMKEILKNKENKKITKNSSLPATLQLICTRKPPAPTHHPVILITAMPGPAIIKVFFHSKENSSSSNGCDIPTKSTLSILIEPLRMSQSDEENLLVQRPDVQMESPKSRIIQQQQQTVELIDSAYVGEAEDRVLRERLDQSLHSVQNTITDNLAGPPQGELPVPRTLETTSPKDRDHTYSDPSPEQEDRGKRNHDDNQVVGEILLAQQADEEEGPSHPKKSSTQDRPLELAYEEPPLGVNYTPEDTAESRDIATAVQLSQQVPTPPVLTPPPTPGAVAPTAAVTTVETHPPQPKPLLPAWETSAFSTEQITYLLTMGVPYHLIPGATASPYTGPPGPLPDPPAQPPGPPTVPFRQDPGVPLAARLPRTSPDDPVMNAIPATPATIRISSRLADLALPQDFPRDKGQIPCLQSRLTDRILAHDVLKRQRDAWICPPAVKRTTMTQQESIQFHARDVMTEQLQNNERQQKELAALITSIANGSALSGAEHHPDNHSVYTISRIQADVAQKRKAGQDQLRVAAETVTPAERLAQTAYPTPPPPPTRPQEEAQTNTTQWSGNTRAPGRVPPGAGTSAPGGTTRRETLIIASPIAIPTLGVLAPPPDLSTIASWGGQSTHDGGRHPRAGAQLPPHVGTLTSKEEQQRKRVQSCISLYTKPPHPFRGKQFDDIEMWMSYLDDHMLAIGVTEDVDRCRCLRRNLSDAVASEFLQTIPSARRDVWADCQEFMLDKYIRDQNETSERQADRQRYKERQQTATETPDQYMEALRLLRCHGYPKDVTTIPIGHAMSPRHAELQRRFISGQYSEPLKRHLLGYYARMAPSHQWTLVDLISYARQVSPYFPPDPPPAFEPGAAVAAALVKPPVPVRWNQRRTHDPLVPPPPRLPLPQSYFDRFYDDGGPVMASRALPGHGRPRPPFIPPQISQPQPGTSQGENPPVPPNAPPAGAHAIPAAAEARCTRCNEPAHDIHECTIHEEDVLRNVWYGDPGRVYDREQPLCPHSYRMDPEGPPDDWLPAHRNNQCPRCGMLGHLAAQCREDISTITADGYEYLPRLEQHEGSLGDQTGQHHHPLPRNEDRIRCLRCTQFGHGAQLCNASPAEIVYIRLLSEQVGTNVEKCKKCLIIGHHARRCDIPANMLPSIRALSYPPGRNPKDKCPGDAALHPHDHARCKCFVCGRRGHLAFSCPQTATCNRPLPIISPVQISTCRSQQAPRTSAIPPVKPPGSTELPEPGRMTTGDLTIDAMSRPQLLVHIQSLNDAINDLIGSTILYNDDPRIESLLIRRTRCVSAIAAVPDVHIDDDGDPRESLLPRTGNHMVHNGRRMSGDDVLDRMPYHVRRQYMIQLDGDMDDLTFGSRLPARHPSVQILHQHYVRCANSMAHLPDRYTHRPRPESAGPPLN